MVIQEVPLSIAVGQPRRLWFGNGCEIELSRLIFQPSFHKYQQKRIFDLTIDDYLETYQGLIRPKVLWLAPIK